jgi:hypothetical protein
MTGLSHKSMADPEPQVPVLRVRSGPFHCNLDPRTGQTTTQTLKVHIPPGVREGQAIRVAGMGEAGIGQGGPGTFISVYAWRPHPDFRVRGADLYYTWT